MLDFMPVRASTWAGQVDALNNFITYSAVFFTIAIVGTMLYFGIKYRRKSEDQKTAYILHNTTLEILWTAIPTVIVIFVFYFGFVVYRDMRTPPANPIEVTVSAKKWQWDFTYETGKKSTNELVVPVGRPVRLIMTSTDVLHSFFIPVMRVKEDVVPGRYHYLWFQPTLEGEYHVFCTEYCGTLHSQMRAKLKVVSEAAFRDYLVDRKDSSQEDLPPAKLGENLFASKACGSCHSIDGSALVGPTLQGIVGSSRKLVDGSEVEADENYLRESILNPNAKIVKGYPQNVMPAFEGQLSEQELQGLIAYIKTLK